MHFINGDLCWCSMCLKFLKKICDVTESILLKMNVLEMKSKIFDFLVLSNFLIALLTFDILVPSCRSCLSRGKPGRSKTIIWTFALQ